jgi:hypothetical protein
MPVTREKVERNGLIEDIENSTNTVDHIQALTDAVLFLLGSRNVSEGEKDLIAPYLEDTVKDEKTLPKAEKR